MVDVGSKKKALSVDAEKGRDVGDRFPDRLQRYGKAKKRSSRMAALIQEFEPKRALKIRNCASWLLFHHYFEVNEYRLVKAYFCKQHLLCAPCALRRAARLLAEFLPKYNQVITENPALKTSLVTLTVKNGEDLAERFNHLQNAVKTLQARRRDSKRKRKWGESSEWSKVLGAIGSYEVTYNNDTQEWHPHVHIIVVSETDLSEYRLKGEWYQITGDSHQCDVSPVRNPDDPAKDFQEIFKYNLKYSDLSEYLNYVAFHNLQRRRLLFSVGLFRGVKVPDKLTDDPLKDQLYIELMYKYFEDHGYKNVPVNYKKGGS